MMNTVKSSEPTTGSLQKLFGLLAMFGVTGDGRLPKYRANVSRSNHAAPQSVQDELIKKAQLKRERRNLARPGRYAI